MEKMYDMFLLNYHDFLFVVNESPTAQIEATTKKNLSIIFTLWSCSENLQQWWRKERYTSYNHLIMLSEHEMPH